MLLLLLQVIWLQAANPFRLLCKLLSIIKPLNCDYAILSSDLPDKMECYCRALGIF